jgi:stage II sporulation protein D
VGLKSDLTEFVTGQAGSPWAVVSGSRVVLLRGPLTFLPEGTASRAFQVQAGAFSQEDPARESLARLTNRFSVPGAVAFSADRGVYRVLLGGFPSRVEADALVTALQAEGQQAFVVSGASIPSPGGAIAVKGEDGETHRLEPPVDLFPTRPEMRVAVGAVSYRGSLRLALNSRGTLNIVNRVDLEEYLFGVVPAEMGPRRFDELEALKAQAVAARTYALAHRGQFESEGYDICATPKCQVYLGLPAEDALSTAAVDATRGLVLAFEGRFADALFVSTCGGRTENVENVFGETPLAYLVSVECGELSVSEVLGARIPRGEKAGGRNGLEWRGYVLRRHAPKRRATRAAALAKAQEWAGVESGSTAPARLDPAAVYGSLLSAFGLGEPRALHLLPRDERYYQEPPSAPGRLSGTAADAYDFALRFRLGAGEPLPPPDRALTEEEYAGLLFSVALRLQGIAEGNGRFLSREGSNLWVKTAEGRLGLPVDPEMPLARRAGDRYLPSGALALRPGDRVRWWKKGSRILALWVEMEPVGPAYERESAWTEWVRRVTGKELARRMAGRLEGEEVRELTVVRRSPSGRAIELLVRTDQAEATFSRFDLRQALGLPEMLFTVSPVRGAEGEAEFLFLGRGWGHGVGLCQNGAFGMALAGATYDRILRHYYTGIEIVPASTVPPSAPSSR